MNLHAGYMQQKFTSEIFDQSQKAFYKRQNIFTSENRFLIGAIGLESEIVIERV